jgi:DNA-binding response OmpR family regulator
MDRPLDFESLRAGPLEVRPSELLALAAGDALSLSVREFWLLVELARRPGRIVTRLELYDLVWGGELRGGDRSVDVYVHKLRVKLESSLPDWRFVHTHVGFGYRFAAEPADARPELGFSRPSTQLSRPFHNPATAS